jgi:AraC family transcriptional activator of pobA
MSADENIKLHALSFGNSLIKVRDIEHNNAYDYTKKHRHSYFELMLFEQGGGDNLIDFVNYDVKAYSCFIIFPKQIHLLHRAPGSFGDLVQFNSSSITSDKLNLIVQEHLWYGRSALLFEEDSLKFKEVKTFIELIKANSRGAYSGETQHALLQSLLFVIMKQSMEMENAVYKPAVFSEFLKLLDSEIKNQHKVRFYSEQLNVSEKKLSQLSKTYLGGTTLSVIHDKLITEIKRLLLHGALSHKEIAYDLGFDSPSSFNAFVKRRTGQTPGEIQNQLSTLGI